MIFAVQGKGARAMTLLIFSDPFHFALGLKRLRHFRVTFGMFKTQIDNVYDQTIVTKTV